jgi:hypothetical protein
LAVAAEDKPKVMILYLILSLQLAAAEEVPATKTMRVLVGQVAVRAQDFPLHIPVQMVILHLLALHRAIKVVTVLLGLRLLVAVAVALV